MADTSTGVTLGDILRGYLMDASVPVVRSPRVRASVVRDPWAPPQSAWTPMARVDLAGPAWRVTGDVTPSTRGVDAVRVAAQRDTHAGRRGVSGDVAWRRDEGPRAHVSYHWAWGRE